MLGIILKSIFSRRNLSEATDDLALAAEDTSTEKKVLNVGGNKKTISIPPQYDGWRHVLLDIDPKGGADVVCDARRLVELARGEYDSIYCSHNLEHYYRHDVAKVLAGFVHVLQDDGFTYIRVPDMGELMRTVVEQGLDIDDLLYQSQSGPIAVSDVIYGYGWEIEQSGNDFYAHKTGFTQKSLTATLINAGFPYVFTRLGDLEIGAIAFKQKPSDEVIALFNINELFVVGAGTSAATQSGFSDTNSDYRVRGKRFLKEGRLDAAAACFRQLVLQVPNDVDGYISLGFILFEQKNYVEAVQFLKKALSIDPNQADGFYLLGLALKGQGDLEGALDNFNKTIELNPNFEAVYRDLCHVLFQSGKNELAKGAILKGLCVNSEVADFHYYLGNLHQAEMEFDKAVACYLKALSIQPDFAEVHNNLGETYRKRGNFDQAIACYRQSLSIKPDFYEGHSNLLFALSCYANCSSEQYLAEARQYGRKLFERIQTFASWPSALSYAQKNDGRRLRVGFVSGDLNAHPVGFFLESILESLNPDRIVLVAYSTRPGEDALTARIKPRFAEWNLVSGLDDKTLAEKIRADGIQILIDLAGHTAHNRLPAFAWKPAPVQVSWLGYFATTGVSAIDYLLADKVSIPVADQHLCTETVWYLPDTRLCFTPPEDAGLECSSTPVLRNGYITFGCFQNLTKITDQVLTVWARILRALPEARLRLQLKQMNVLAERECMRERLEKIGISPERFAIEPAMPRRDYLAAYSEVDVILDTFPFPGGTTTCEAMWMGVPTITLAGETFLARQGASLLGCAGLHDWVAIDEDDYVARAVAYASDIDRLVQLRQGLREKVRMSPLFDAPRFALNFESALYAMWEKKQDSDQH